MQGIVCSWKPGLRLIRIFSRSEARLSPVMLQSSYAQGTRFEVENDEGKWVGNDRRKTIDRDETNTIHRDRTETV